MSYAASNGLVAVVAVGAGSFLFAPRLRSSKAWRATVTPLASIIGSGFLVSVPLLAEDVGNWAIVAMALLVCVSYFVGSAIRFNIRHAEPLLSAGRLNAEMRFTVSLERFSHFVLAFAYFVSVAYYLVLLGNFLLKGADVQSPDMAKLVATVILAVLGLLGLLRGLGMVEGIEKYAVGINLAVIASLLAGLLFYNATSLADGDWHLAATRPQIDGHTLRVLLGLLIVVQGFETSRFMGDEFDADTRIRTMRNAQLIAAAVYLVFFGLVTVLFGSLGSHDGIAAIINLVGYVSPILPLALVVSAVASQFSASVADSVGCAGLLEDIAGRRLSPRHAYPLIAVIAIAITWNTDVFRLVTLASQAFAFFYFVQCCVAFSLAWADPGIERRGQRLVLFAAAGAFCLGVTLLGIPAST
jgi:hypothetical protein